MVKVVEKNSIRIGREPVVVLPLRKWEKMKELLEDLEDALRFNQAISDPENQKIIPFERVKKQLNLP